jgi:glycosyltransferase involved in cell wall biosynthesis
VRRSRADVKWLDYVTRDELRALFASARAFVFPTLAEGFGLPVLEAFAAGTRVIASDLPALRELAEGHAVFVPAGDIAALTAAMQDAATRPADIAQIASAKMLARRFDWRSTAAATLRVYQEALARSGPRPR